MDIQSDKSQWGVSSLLLAPGVYKATVPYLPHATDYLIIEKSVVCYKYVNKPY